MHLEDKEKNIQSYFVECITKKLHIAKIISCIENGASVDHADTKGTIPLHRAVDVNFIDCIIYLISKGADINKINDSGFTPLLLAASRGNAKVVQILIDGGAIIDYCDGRGVPDHIREMGYLTYDPLNISLENNHYECARLLLKKGANPNKKYYMGYEINLAPISNLLCLELLLKHGANPNLTSRYGATPLFRACKENRIGATRLLVNYGANVNLQCRLNFQWITPINYAIELGATEIVRILLKSGACLRRQSGCKYSPLQIAILSGRLDVFKLLINQNCLVDERSEDGYTALMLAVKLGGHIRHQADFVHYLLSNGADPNILIHDSNTSILSEYLNRNATNCDLCIVRLFLKHGATVSLLLDNPFGVIKHLGRLSNIGAFYLICDASEQIDTRAVLKLERLQNGYFGAQQIEYLTKPRPLQALVKLVVRKTLNKPSQLNSLGLPSCIVKSMLYE